MTETRLESKLFDQIAGSIVSNRAEPATGAGYSFGRFQLFPKQGLLLEGDKPVHIGSRALAILTVLLDHEGNVVTKEELVSRVWPDISVEEGTLRVHIAALRKALGDGHGESRFVLNIPGRGYRFVASVTPVAESSFAEEPPSSRSRGHNLPAHLTRVVGRTEVTASLAKRLPAQRLVTITGPGGIGKTTVALQVAKTVVESYSDGAWFVDLAPLTDQTLVPTAVASALGLPVLSDDPTGSLIAHLSGKRLLLVLDNCEQIIDAAAAFASEVLKRTRHVHILATSREPLRAEGENVYRLSSLGLPPPLATLSATTALSYPSIQLFVERAVAALGTFELTDSDAPVVAEICHKLDGIALAIELAAGRVDSFGVRGIADALGDRFRILSRGRRTLLRHQTMRATLDWSVALLGDVERTVFRHLSIFAGQFPMDLAVMVLESEDLPGSEIIECTANLVSKSLVVTDLSDAIGRYRLLDTMRAYGREQLLELGEADRLARSHARCLRDLFRRNAVSSWEALPTDEWYAVCRGQIDNVRAALEWSFSQKGDLRLGVELTAAVVPLWLQLSLIEESRVSVSRALEVLDQVALGDTQVALELYAAAGIAQIYLKGSPENALATWKNVLRLAERLNDPDRGLLALWALWIIPTLRGEYVSSLSLAESYLDAATTAGRHQEMLIGHRMIGTSLHYRGDQAAARREIDHMIDQYPETAHWSNTSNRLQAQTIQARIQWIRGLPDRAIETIRSAIEEARGVVTAASICLALAEGGFVIALLNGDLDAARMYLELLRDEADRHSLDLWQRWAHRHAIALRVIRRDESIFEELTALVKLHRETGPGPDWSLFLAILAEGLSAVGRTADGFPLIDEALEHSERNHEGWCRAELLRVRGVLFAASDGLGKFRAEEHLLQALEAARSTGDLSWELRIALDLSRLRLRQGRKGEALDLLSPIYAQLGEGFATQALVAARTLLEQLQ